MNIRRSSTALAVAVSLAGSGCMGTFALTKTLYGFNSSVTDSKFINNVIFWAFLILPVYSISFFIDGAVLNLIEFWTGKNPLVVNDLEQLDDGSLRLARDGHVIEARPDGADRVLVLQDGVVIGVLERTADGTLVVSDAQGVARDALSPAEQVALAPTVAALAQ
jgi:Domain of unknown function (DUF3332)